MAYKAIHIVFGLEQNVQQAICNALNKAIPDAYKQKTNNGIGTVPYNVTDNPRDILNNLQLVHGQPTSEETEQMEENWRAGWQSSQPIKELFLQLEEVYITALIYVPPYTIPQLIKQAYIAI